MRVVRVEVTEGGTVVAEWEEPRHPGPFRLSRGDCTPLSPTLQHNSFHTSHNVLRGPHFPVRARRRDHLAFAPDVPAPAALARTGRSRGSGDRRRAAGVRRVLELGLGR